MAKTFWRRFGAMAVVVVALATEVGGASSASSRSSRLADQQRREVVTALLRVSPSRPSASLSRRFVHADVGIESLRLTLPRDLHAELLIRNPVEALTGQPPSTMLCVPFRLCHDAGQTALRFCRTSGTHTICAYSTDAGAVFRAGRFVVTLRELVPQPALALVRVVFVRGLGG
jgi:hypothetical protein